MGLYLYFCSVFSEPRKQYLTFKFQFKLQFNLNFNLLAAAAGGDPNDNLPQHGH